MWLAELLRRGSLRPAVGLGRRGAGPDRRGTWRLCSRGARAQAAPGSGGESGEPFAAGPNRDWRARAAEDAGGRSSTSRQGPPEILFEDVESLLEEGFGHDGPLDWEAEAGQGQRPRPAMPKKPPPVSDEELAELELSTLALDELIWAIGRAATLKLTDGPLWHRFAEAIASWGEAELSPSEVCRLVQAFAYAPKEAPINERQLQRLLKAFATRIAEYDDERLMRLIYGYGKLAAKRGLSMQRFLDFAGSEVVERKSLKGWRRLRILRAVGHLPGAGQELKSVLVAQVLKDVEDLDTESWRAFVPMLVEQRLHERPGVVHSLNKVYKQKVFCYKNPDLLLRSGLPLVLKDLMKTTTLVIWLLRLHELRVPITASMAMSAAQSGFTASGLDAAWRAARNLESLKVAELYLRHERPEMLAVLPPGAQHLLTVARRTPLDPPEDFEILELPFVFASLGRLFRRLGYVLHPTIYGPYLLELADPLGRLVVEWDSNWALYPPWRRQAHEDFVRRKHLLLRAEGWRVLCVPLAAFQALPDRAARLDFARRFAGEQGLEHLRAAG